MRRFVLGVCLVSLALPCAAQPLRVVGRDVEPFLYRKGGKVAGVDYEILSYYAHRVKRPLQFVWVAEFDDILKRLAAGDADIAASGITLTAARRQRFGDSGPYLPVRVTIVEPLARTTTALSQLRGHTVATMKGTTYEAILSKEQELKLVYGVDERDLIAMVAEGRAEATAVDTVPALFVLPKYPGLHLTLPVSELQHYGYYVAKGSPLGEDLARHIQQLRSGNIYYTVLKKYLGPQAADMIKAAMQ
jgi:polar amino acid transport system substrate-binding protein